MSLRVECTVARAAFKLDARLLLEPGITWLRGTSGSGKTTLLRALAGLERDVLGTITCGPHVWLSATQCLPVHARRSCMVPQNPRLWPHHTVLRNLEASEHTQGILAELIASFELAPLLERSGDEVSAGEAQRIAVVRALAGAPKVLLLDEPFSAQPRLFAELMVEALKSAAQKVPVLVAVHHDPTGSALEHGRVLAIENGAVRA
jgi:molybdate transport system ATP-binding protein